MKAMKKEKVVGKSSIYFRLPFNAVWAFGTGASIEEKNSFLTFFFLCVKYLNFLFGFMFKDDFPSDISSVMGLEAQFLT